MEAYATLISHMGQDQSFDPARDPTSINITSKSPKQSPQVVFSDPQMS